MVPIDGYLQQPFIGLIQIKTATGSVLWSLTVGNDEIHVGKPVSFDIFNSMSMRSANLVTVKFTRGFVDGKALLAAVGLAQEPGRIGVLRLPNFRLERTNGVTEEDCAGLRRLGKRVNVVT
jgi:hypothetical protein